eukprot:1738526-Prymnesium_polylepis.2
MNYGLTLVVAPIKPSTVMRAPLAHLTLVIAQHERCLNHSRSILKARFGSFVRTYVRIPRARSVRAG